MISADHIKSSVQKSEQFGCHHSGSDRVRGWKIKERKNKRTKTTTTATEIKSKSSPLGLEKLQIVRSFAVSCRVFYPISRKFRLWCSKKKVNCVPKWKNLLCCENIKPLLCQKSWCYNCERSDISEMAEHHRLRILLPQLK